MGYPARRRRDGMWRGKGGAVSWNDGPLIYSSVGVAAEQSEPAGAGYERIRQKPGAAGLCNGPAAGGPSLTA